MSFGGGFGGFGGPPGGFGGPPGGFGHGMGHGPACGPGYGSPSSPGFNGYSSGRGPSFGSGYGPAYGPGYGPAYGSAHVPAYGPGYGRRPYLGRGHRGPHYGPISYGYVGQSPNVGDEKKNEEKSEEIVEEKPEERLEEKTENISENTLNINETMPPESYYDTFKVKQSLAGPGYGKPPTNGGDNNNWHKKVAIMSVLLVLAVIVFKVLTKIV